MERRNHWERIYADKGPRDVSWFQVEATLSRTLIAGAVRDSGAVILDVGGGASPLAAELGAHGYRRLVVLDLSAKALLGARRAGGVVPDPVLRVVGDGLAVPLGVGAVGLWHDRAVFHFLIDAGSRAGYLAEVRRTVGPGGFVLVATFAEDGPERCSGLPVVRYSARELADTFGAGFELLESRREVHRTPSGAAQPFTYGLFRRSAPSGSPSAPLR